MKEKKESRLGVGVSAKHMGSAFDAPAQSPGFLLWHVSMAWQRRLRAALEPLGLTHVQFVLLAVSEWLSGAEGNVTQVRIASQANVDIMMTSQVLRTLEAKEFVRRMPHPTDTRAKCVELTAAGKKLVKRAIEVVEREDEAYFAGLKTLRTPFVSALKSLSEK